MENLIISCAWGYAPTVLEPLLRTSARHCPDANVVLLVDRVQQEDQAILREYNPRTILYGFPNRRLRKLVFGIRGKQTIWRFLRPVLRFAPVLKRRLSPLLTHVSLARYFVARAALRNEFAHAKRVLLCDSRDVVFQGDPFAPLDVGLATGLEDRTIGECEFNSRWIQSVYGVAEVERLKGKRIVCSGVTIGRRLAMLNYLDAVCGEFTEHIAETAFTGALDQGVHNWLIHSGQLPGCQLVSNGSGMLNTLHYANLDNWGFDERSGMLGDNGTPVKILHQYDRHEGLRDWVTKTAATGASDPVGVRSSSPSHTALNRT